MILSISFELKMLSIALLNGLILGILYDFLKVFRIYFVHNKILINIEDCIFWIFMAISIFLLLLYQNDGQIRLFYLIGIFFSFTIYTLLFSKLFINICIKIITFLNKLLKIIIFSLNLVLKPILFILKFIKNILQNNKFCVKIYSKLKFYFIKKGGNSSDEKV